MVTVSVLLSRSVLVIPPSCLENPDWRIDPLSVVDLESERINPGFILLFNLIDPLTAFELDRIWSFVRMESPPNLILIRQLWLLEFTDRCWLDRIWPNPLFDPSSISVSVLQDRRLPDTKRTWIDKIELNYRNIAMI